MRFFHGLETADPFCRRMRDVHSERTWPKCDRLAPILLAGHCDIGLNCYTAQIEQLAYRP